MILICVWVCMLQGGCGGQRAIWCVFSLFPPLRGFQELNSGHRTCIVGWQMPLCFEPFHWPCFSFKWLEHLLTIFSIIYLFIQMFVYFILLTFTVYVLSAKYYASSWEYSTTQLVFSNRRQKLNSKATIKYLLPF